MNIIELSLRIRSLRKSRGMTLATLAQASGLTESMMSKIENFRVTPSLPAIGAIARALGTTLSALFEGLDRDPQISVVRVGDRQPFSRDESPWSYFSLAGERMNRVMDPVLVELPPNGQRERADAHEGEEFMMVIEGQMDFVYGEQTVSLSAGDAVYSDGNVEHNLINRASGVTKVLVVYCRMGAGSSG